MRNLITGLLFTVIGFGIATTQSGCVAAAAGAAGGAIYAYSDGELTDRVNAGPEKVVAATKAAMADLKLDVLSATGDGLEGRVESRVGADNKAVVKVKSEGNNVSKVNIRIGTFGDESLSKQIMEKIKAHL